MTKLKRASIIQKTLQVGAWTAISRLLGLVRTILTIRYLGADAVSDAFLTAYKIPNSFRKIFAEGALSAAFIPTFVQIIRKGEVSTAQSVMTLSFIIFEGMVLIFSGLIFAYAPYIIWLIAPGFTPEHINATVPLLRILIFFLFFISSSALLAGALQAVHRFTIPAIAPVILNIVFISGLAFCIAYNVSITYFCYWILVGGCIQFLIHVAAYFHAHFRFSAITLRAYQEFKPLIKKFSQSFLSMSVVEINLFIDTMFASFLASGSLSLIDYGSRFMQIPLSIFSTAFATILLPHFSYVGSYAPRRLGFYLLESAKLIFFICIPATIGMCVFAPYIFSTLFLSNTITVAQAQEAEYIFIAFTLGLVTFSLNKILLNIYYALHDTFTPTLIALIATGTNIVLNALFMALWRAPGLALATTISSIIQCILFLVMLRRKFTITYYSKSFLLFCWRFLKALVIVGFIFYIVYQFILKGILYQLPEQLKLFFTKQIGFWLWVGPLFLVCFSVLFLIRRRFKLRLYFLP